MTIEQILEILENYKLRIPPTVFYDLKADIVNFEEPTTKNVLGVDCISREQALEPYKILENTDTLSVYTIRQNLAELSSVTPKKETITYLDGFADGLNMANNSTNKMLEKIRAEIEDLDRFYDNDYFSGNRDSMFKCNEVMEILDKYKAENNS